MENARQQNVILTEFFSNLSNARNNISCKRQDYTAVIKVVRPAVFFLVFPYSTSFIIYFSRILIGLPFYRME